MLTASIRARPPFAASRRFPTRRSGRLIDGEFGHIARIALLGPDASDRDWELAADSGTAVILSGAAYAAEGTSGGRIDAVLIEQNPASLAAIGRRYLAAEHRPLVLHTFLPGEHP